MSLLKRIESGQAQGQRVPAGPQVEPKAAASRLGGMGVKMKLPPGGAQRDPYYDLKTRVQNKLLAELDPSMDVSQTAEVRQTIEELFENILTEEKIVLSRPERRRLFEQIVAEILGLGPIEPLLADETITEVMVNGAKNIYIERGGRLYREPAAFETDDHLMRIIDRIVAPLGRRIDESSPYVDARLPDGSRVNAVIPPISLVGPALTIRKFARNPITVEQLIEYGTITAESVEFLKACVEARLNIFVSGGTGSGKTTTLNVLSSFIPNDERIITIEDAAELQLRQEHVVTLEARPPNIEGKGQVPIRELVRNALRMRPDRIIVGECRGGEALDMIQAMTVGHEGSLSTGHANSPEDSLMRLETMALMAKLPVLIFKGVPQAVPQLVERTNMTSPSVTFVPENEL